MVYLPTCTITINQMSVNIPYMDPMGTVIYCYTLFWVVVSNTVFVFSPWFLGEMIQFDEHIFQQGWFNHQLVLSRGMIPQFYARILCFM